MVMKYFVDEEKRKASHSTGYFEFQQGKYHNRCWLPDSISIHMDDFDDLHLYELIASVVPAFNYYGLTEITVQDWDNILHKARSAGGDAAAAMNEANQWVQTVFLKESVFTICGI